jgi:hypothetical protein
MSENPPAGWEPPSGSPPPPAPSGPSYGQPAPPPSYGQPPPPPSWGQPAPQYGYGQLPPPVYGVPAAPKPGVVPLRPLSVGEILDGAVQTIRQNPKVMLGLAAVVNLVLAVAVVLIQVVVLRATISSGNPFDQPDADSVGVGDVLAPFVQLVVQWVGSTLLTGVLVISVSEAVLGRRPSIGQVWARARGRLWALLGVTVLVTLGIIGIVVAVLVPGFIVLLAGSTPGGAVLLVFGGLAAVPLALWVAVRWLFASPAVLLERIGVWASFSRSSRLISGSWWRCLGIWLLAQVLASVVAGVLQVPFIIAAAVIGSGPVSVVVGLVGGVIARTLVAPFSAAILALLYIDLRMRREGLDVTLQQAAAAAGSPT